jgi:hypothetical protein
MNTHHTSEQHAEKSPSVNKAVAIIIIFCFIGIIPILTLWSIPPANPPVATSPAPASVMSAASAAGLKICSTGPVTYKAPGLQTASIYQLSSDCGKVTKNNSVFVLVADFSSVNAMNSALRVAMGQLSSYRAVNFMAFTDGTEVIIVAGSPGNTYVQKVGASLQEQGAVEVAAGS